MIGLILSALLPDSLLWSIEKRREFFRRYKLLWNSANALSIFRVVMFLIVLAMPSFNQGDVIKWYVLLTFSDKVDGWLAVLTGNNNGIGTVIDPLCDKVFHFAGLQYLLFAHLLAPAILGYLATLFEGLTLFVALACCQLFWDKDSVSFREAFAALKSQMTRELHVNPFGKAKMVAYFLGIAALLLYLYAPSIELERTRVYLLHAKPLLKNLYISFFSFGIVLAAIALLLYIYEALKFCLKYEAEKK